MSNYFLGIFLIAVTPQTGVIGDAVHMQTGVIGDAVHMQFPTRPELLRRVGINDSISYSYSVEDKESIIPTQDEIKLQNMVNAVRQNPSSVGWGSYPAVAPLQPNINLWKAAQFHSQEMIDSGYFAHDSYDSHGNMYETWDKRITQRFGYAPEGQIGENIAGNSTVEGAFEAWLDSQGHRENIFSSSYSEDGIGIAAGGPYGKMFTHDFGYRSIQFDLSISSSDISFSPNNPQVGDNVQITAAVHELKKTHAFPVAVQFFDGNPASGGQLIKEDTVDAIINYNGVENAIITWNTTGGDSGVHELWVKVDPANKFSETNENNNSAFKNITLAVTGIEEVPKVFGENVRIDLSVSYNKEIELTYSLDFKSNCLLKIYNSCGNLVATLVNENKEPGCYRILWNKRDSYNNKVPSGIYFCNLACGNIGVTRTIVILK